MKIRIDRDGDDTHIQVERDPLALERFTALCKLARAAIGGGVLLGAIALVGFWAIPWVVGALVAVLMYRLIRLV